MGRVFVAPLGFHEDFVLRSLVKFKAMGGDSLYVVTCGPVVSAVKRAIDGLVAITSRQGLPQPVLVELDCNFQFFSLYSMHELCHDSFNIVYDGRVFKFFT